MGTRHGAYVDVYIDLLLSYSRSERIECNAHAYNVPLFYFSFAVGVGIIFADLPPLRIVLGQK